MNEFDFAFRDVHQPLLEMVSVSTHLTLYLKSCELPNPIPIFLLDPEFVQSSLNYGNIRNHEEIPCGEYVFMVADSAFRASVASFKRSYWDYLQSIPLLEDFQYDNHRVVFLQNSQGEGLPFLMVVERKMPSMIDQTMRGVVLPVELDDAPKLTPHIDIFGEVLKDAHLMLVRDLFQGFCTPVAEYVKG